MFYPVSKAIWLTAAPTNGLILTTAAASLWAMLRLSKCAALPAAGGACAAYLRFDASKLLAKPCRSKIDSHDGKSGLQRRQ
jgi:hypothetical protein